MEDRGDKALLDVWGAESVQNTLDSVVRNRVVCQKVASDLAELGYQRTWQQCKTKIRILYTGIAR